MTQIFMKGSVLLLLLLLTACSEEAALQDSSGVLPTILPTAQSVQPDLEATDSPTDTAAPKPSEQPTATKEPQSATPSKQPVPATSGAPDQSAGPITSQEAKSIIEARTKEAIAALKAGDMGKLKELTHPDKGIRFSLYGHVNNKEDLSFMPEQLAKLVADETTYSWGYFDGSGEPVELTFKDFYSQFLYNHDYASPEQIGYNETLGRGNSTNNIRDVYPGSIVVEYYFSGFDKKVEGFDWASLCLVYEKLGDQWYLCGMVRNQWTI